MIDAIFPYSITPFEELIYDNPPGRDIHLILATPGGDGETAVRLVRAAQARCKELTVIVPDVAKSAGTLLALGAHWILMGPASDLGPIDPQFQFPDGSLVSAKDMIAAVDDATKKVQDAPDTYPIHAALLSDVTALMVQQARSELLRTGDLLEEALASNPDRTSTQVTSLKKKLRVPLIQRPKTHAAIFNVSDAKKLGLPAVAADIAGEQWERIWRLWAKYFAMGPPRVYEGAKASVIIPWTTGSP
jgi:ClpP class serine protease